MIVPLFLLMFFSCQVAVWTIRGPQSDPSWEPWLAWITYRKIISMTEELARDLIYKLKYAEKIESNFKHTLNYEIGYISSRIQGSFKFMVETYRKYSRLDSFTYDYKIPEFLSALATVQGCYAEVRMHHDMFYQVIEHRKHEEKERLKKRTYDRYKQKWSDDQKEGRNQRRFMTDDIEVIDGILKRKKLDDEIKEAFNFLKEAERKKVLDRLYKNIDSEMDTIKKIVGGVSYDQIQGEYKEMLSQNRRTIAQNRRLLKGIENKREPNEERNEDREVGAVKPARKNSHKNKKPILWRPNEANFDLTTPRDVKKEEEMLEMELLAAQGKQFL